MREPKSIFLWGPDIRDVAENGHKYANSMHVRASNEAMNGGYCEYVDKSEYVDKLSFQQLRDDAEMLAEALEATKSHWDRAIKEVIPVRKSEMFALSNAVLAAFRSRYPKEGR